MSSPTDRDGERSCGERLPDFVVEELLDHPYRRAIVEMVRERPGVNKHQIAQAVEVDPKVVDHHLAKLEDMGLVTTRSREEGKQVHCFAKGDEQVWEEASTRGLFGRSGAREVALFLADHPGAKTSEIAKALELSTTTVRHHLLGLREAGLVRQHQAGRAYLYDATGVLDDWVETVGDRFERPWLD